MRAADSFKCPENSFFPSTLSPVQDLGVHTPPLQTTCIGSGDRAGGKGKPGSSTSLSLTAVHWFTDGYGPVTLLRFAGGSRKAQFHSSERVSTSKLVSLPVVVLKS